MNPCECGCGQVVQRRFAHGHHRRTTFGPDAPGWRGDRAAYTSIHDWLVVTYPKRGACESCGSRGATDYAFLHHPNSYSRNRVDYAELCRSCHHRLDEPHAKRGERLRRQKALKS